MIITLITDFGARDPFVGIMKGVIKSIAPHADIIDLTHHISPQDILEGSLLWAVSAPYFPDGTIHVGVVDPGVGTSRRPVAVRFRKQIFVYPDNGLMTHLLGEAQPDEAHIIADPRWTLPDASRTFHGRDIFSPAAAHLANGIALEQLGPAAENLVRLPIQRPAITGTSISGEIVRFDHFGNAWTNIPESAADIPGKEWEVRAAGQQIGKVSPSYGVVQHGAPLAIFASHGHLEIAISGGNARAMLGLSVGDEVVMEPEK